MAFRHLRARLGYLLVLLVVAVGMAGAQPVTPADADLWQARRALFEYDRTQPLNATTGAWAEGARLVQERIEFDSPRGGRVAGVLVFPQNPQKPPPVVLFLHGLGGSKQDAAMAGTVLAASGWATLGLDAAGHGDRKQPEERFFGPEAGAAQTNVVQTVVDYRRAMDYLETREDVDASRIALVGASMGAMVGTIVTAVDDRVEAALLIVGGGGWATLVAESEHPVAAVLRQRLAQNAGARGLEDVDPVNYVGHISPRPVWMINGRQDRIVPPASAELLHEAAREPKRVVWYDGGHIPNLPALVQTFSEWMEQVLGAVPGAQERIPAEPAGEPVGAGAQAGQ